MRSTWWGVAILLVTGLLLVFPSSRLQGQAVNATLLGTVTDVSGAVVPGTKVEIREVNTGSTRSIVTNESGNYVFADLPPGQYQVSVEKQGFKKEVHAAVDVLVNSTVRVDLKLEPGALSETIEVTADTPMLQTDRVDIGQKIETRQVEDLPLGFNRNFQNLLNLVPGTVRAHRDHSEFFNSQDSLSTEVNGQARQFNNLLVEGVDDNERTGLLQVYIPPAEAIQTVDVTTSNYAAEFGRAGGAVTNVVLKSGVNAFHGAAYEFNRVSALAARSFFNRPPGFFPRTTYNYYGGNLGGPIIKNRLFFFGDILRISDSRGRFNRVTVPTDAFRQGDFSAAGVNIYNPFTGNPNDGTNRQQFSYRGTANVIDPALISPIALKILEKVPHANVPGCPSPACPVTGNFQNTTRFLKNTTTFDTKLDYNRSNNDRLAFRFSRSVQDANDQPIFGLAGGPGGAAGDGFQGTGVQHIQSGALNHTYVFSPTLIVETRVGVSHYRNVAHSADFGSKASEEIGIKGVNLNDFTSGLVDIRLTTNVNNDNPLVGYSPSLPWDRGETNINLVNNWTKIHANHTFKWGADIRRLRDDLVQAQTFSPRGRFDFGTGTTALNAGQNSPRTSLANDFAAFLIDMPTRVGRDISIVSGSWRETEVFTFVQDKWQVTPKLTLDAGVRWELYFPATPSRPGRFSNYDPNNNVLVIAGIGGNPTNLGRETYYRYFAPRFGIAYRLKENTVFRAGFGISYEPFPNNQYAFNFPVRQNNEFRQPNSFAVATVDGQLNSPPVRMATGFPAPAPTVVPSNGLLTPRSAEEYNVIDKKFRQPYVESWNLAIQRALPHKFVLDVAYVGNHGVRVPVRIDLNAAVAPALNPDGSVAKDTCPVRPLCKLPGGPLFGRTGTTNFLFKPTISSYNALQVKLDHRWASGFLLTTAYTFGKALAYRSDQGSDDGSVTNYLNFQRNYSVVSRNRKHTFVQSSVYELPFGRGKPFLKSGWANWIAGGWQLSGILTWMSGTPMNFTSSGNLLNAPGTTQTPNQVGPFHVLGGIDNDLWFDTSAFVPVTTPGVLGNMQRYAFAGPHLFNLDASLFRKLSISERVGLEFRAEAFSVTNTPHFANPNTNASNPADFGHIRGLLSSTDGGNRTVQLGAKITF